MLLHFAKAVQWELAAALVGAAAVVVVGWGETLFVFIRFFLKFVFSSSFVARASLALCRLVRQSANQLQNYSWFLWLCLVVDSLFEQSFQWTPYWLWGRCRGKCETLFSKLAVNGIFLHYRCRERVWARVRWLIEQSSDSTVAVRQQHDVGAELGWLVEMGRIDHALKKRE